MQWKSQFELIEKVSFKNNILRLSLKKKGTYETWKSILSMARLYPFAALKAVKNKSESFKGTGPYKIDSFSSVQAWYLKKNSKSWYLREHKNSKFPDYIRVQKLLSTSHLRGLLRKHELNAFVDYGHSGLNLKKQTQKFNYYPLYPKKTLKVLAFNLESKSVNSLEKRKCILSTLPSSKQMQKLIPAQAKLRPAIALFRKEQKPTCLKLNKNSSLDLIYTSTRDKKWLEVWQQNALKKGLELRLQQASLGRVNRLLKKKDYQVRITQSLDVANRFPFSSFHSQGAYNSQGWKLLALDQLLEHKQQTFQPQKRLAWNKKIRDLVEIKEAGFVSLFSFQRNLALSLKKCEFNRQNKSFWWSLLNCHSLSKSK